MANKENEFVDFPKNLELLKIPKDGYSAYYALTLGRLNMKGRIKSTHLDKLRARLGTEVVKDSKLGVKSAKSRISKFKCENDGGNPSNYYLETMNSAYVIEGDQGNYGGEAEIQAYANVFNQNIKIRYFSRSTKEEKPSVKIKDIKARNSDEADKKEPIYLKWIRNINHYDVYCRKEVPLDKVNSELKSFRKPDQNENEIKLGLKIFNPNLIPFVEGQERGEKLKIKVQDTVKVEMRLNEQTPSTSKGLQASFTNADKSHDPTNDNPNNTKQHALFKRVHMKVSSKEGSAGAIEIQNRSPKKRSNFQSKSLPIKRGIVKSSLDEELGFDISNSNSPAKRSRDSMSEDNTTIPKSSFSSQNFNRSKDVKDSTLNYFITGHQNCNGTNSYTSDACEKHFGGVKGLIAISISDVRNTIPKNFGDFEFHLSTEEAKFHSRVGVFINKSLCNEITSSIDQEELLPPPSEFKIKNTSLDNEYDSRIHVSKFNLNPDKFSNPLNVILISLYAPVMETNHKDPLNKRDKEAFADYLGALIDHLRKKFPGSKFVAQGDFNANPFRVSKLKDPTGYKYVNNVLWNAGLNNHNYRYGIGLNKKSNEYKSKSKLFTRYGMAKKTVQIKKGEPYEGKKATKDMTVKFVVPTVSFIDFTYSDIDLIDSEYNTLIYLNESYQFDVASDHLMVFTQFILTSDPVMDSPLDELRPKAVRENFVIKKKLNTCTWKRCGKVLSHSFHVSRHIRAVHLGLRPIKCSDCTSEFGSRTELQQHQAQKHSDERNYPCPNCQSIFKSVNVLRKHTKIVHNKIRDYQCSICTKFFVSPSNLLTHMNIHTGKRFVCEVCDASFSRKESLQRHIEEVHTLIKYPCRYCLLDFTKRVNLQRHIRNKHAGKPIPIFNPARSHLNLPNQDNAHMKSKKGFTTSKSAQIRTQIVKILASHRKEVPEVKRTVQHVMNLTLSTQDEVSKALQARGYDLEEAIILLISKDSIQSEWAQDCKKKKTKISGSDIENAKDYY